MIRGNIVENPQPVGDATAPIDDVFVFPATVGQLGFWYLDQLRPGDPVYNVPIRYRLQGPLDIAVLERALNEIVRRHEALRTTFAAQNGVAVQIVAPRLKVPLPMDDLTGIVAPDRDAQCEEAIAIEGRMPFALTKGPLVRARLFRLGDENHVLVLTYHHIIVDGWSLGLITDELAALYGAYTLGLESPLDEPSIQYGDFAVWQSEWLKCKDLDDQLAYWTEKLRDLPTFELPADQSGLPEQSPGGAIESRFLPEPVRAGLSALCRKEKVSPFMVTLAVFQALLQRDTGKNDIIVGSVQAGRGQPEVEPLVGLFINPLVLRTDVSGNPTFVELLGRVRETVLQAFANRDAPFGRVVDAVQPKRDPSRHPLFQINFLHQRAFLWPRSASGLNLTPVPSLSTGSMFDLNFFLIERAEGLQAACDYKTERYSAARIRRMLEHFQSLLTAALADPSRRISDLPLGAPESPAPGIVRPIQPATKTPLHAPSAQPDFVAPRGPIETRLAEIWERLLLTSPVSVIDDFFDLGGHSLLAMRLLAEVNASFGRKISLAALMTSPTIEAMAVYLGSEKCSIKNETRLAEEAWEDPETRVFPMRIEGTRPPLLLVDAGPFLRPLVRALGSDQPVYGIALPELRNLPAQFTIRDVAADLVKVLRESKVRPPYYLAGWSNGGLIAYEMAHQLHHAGDQVAQLMLLDTYNPDYRREFQGLARLPVRLCLRFQKYRYHLGRMLSLPWRQRWNYFRTRMRRFEIPKGDGSNLMYGWQMQYVAAAEYRPQPADWPITLARSTALKTGLFRDPHLGWDRVARAGLQVDAMRGEHDTMFVEPEVQRLAEVIRQRMPGSRQGILGVSESEPSPATSERAS